MSVRQHIIDAAYQILCEKGFAKTTVQEIVDRSGSSKGGFYHHFKTKEDVVEAITFDFIKELEKRYKDLAASSSKSVYDLINSVIKQANEYKIGMIKEWPGIAKMMSFDGNSLVIQSMAKEFEKTLTRAYHTFFLRGIDEGKFKIKYPLQLARMFAREILQIYNTLSELLMISDEQLLQDFENTLDFTEHVINSNLGLKQRKILVKQEALSSLEQIKIKAHFLKERIDD